MNPQNRKLITLAEYGELPLSELEKRIHKSGINLIKRLNLRHGVELFRLLHDSIKATQFVGFVRSRDHTIQVIPKIFGDNHVDNLHFLLQLLRYTKKIRIKEHDLGHLSKLKDDFLEVIIYLFAKNLRELLRRDFKKTYVNQEENIPFLKGKLLQKDHIRANSVDNTRYFCRYEDFTENNLMNQVFKYTASLIMRISSSNANKKLLEDILVYLCDVDFVAITPSDLDNVHFTRLNAQYEPSFNICRLILENTSVQFSYSRLETFVFMFDMNRLFEEFVFEFIRGNKPKILVDGRSSIAYMRSQFPLGKLFSEFSMRGDILIQDSTGRKILLDTKYKTLADDMAHSGLSQSDLYQMFAYAISQEQKYQDIVLLYPLPEVDEKKVNQRILIHALAGQDPIKVHIKTIKLTRIFDRVRQKIDENAMVSELNSALHLSLP